MCFAIRRAAALRARLSEIAQSAGVGMILDEAAIPITEEVKGACEILGLDPLYVANEGKLLAIVAPCDAQCRSHRDEVPSAGNRRHPYRRGDRRASGLRPHENPRRAVPASWTCSPASNFPASAKVFLECQAARADSLSKSPKKRGGMDGNYNDHRVDSESKRLQQSGPSHQPTPSSKPFR